MERDKEIILDIRDAINKIFSYTTNVNFDDFVTNDEKQDAVIRRIMIIGEATKR
ncbi:MAG: HepT-like ribonuclease domain-containing protein, partial [Microcoleaceae cyanobacterium]